MAFYPSHLRSLFTDRERELDLLQQATASLADGRPRHLALFGLRRIGKTLLLLEHAARLLETSPAGSVRPVYVDFEELVTSPELFSRRYVGLVTFWAITQGSGEIESFLTPTGLLGGPAAGLRTVAQTLAALQDARDDPATQVTLALDFPEKLAQELDCRLLLLLDEFTELAVLSNYPSVRRPLQLFRAAMQRHSRLGYVIAASAISAMEKMVQDGRSPLFLQFEQVEVSHFPPDATLALVERILGYTPSPGVGRRLHQLTGGHPFYIHAVTTRLVQRQTFTRASSEIGPDDVSRAFILETLSRTGQIYNYCRYLYDISLQRARGYGILKAILQVLAEEEKLTLSELARRIHKTAPTTRGYLRALQEVDMVVENEGVYFYRDPVLRYWAAYTTRGIEVDAFASRTVLSPLLADLEAQYSRLSTELGLAQESSVRELLRRLAGRKVDGALLGTSAPVQLPAFVRVEPYRSPDGQIQVDALAETSEAENGERWAVEVKWRGKAVGKKELAALLQKARSLNARPWCVSRSGFTPAAREYATAHSILISTRVALEELERQLLKS